MRIRSGFAVRHRNIQGSAALEFGLFIPLLAILLTGVVEIGFAMYQAMQVSYAAEAAMFYAMKNGFNSTGISSAATTATGLTGLNATASQFCGCPGTSGITNVSCSSTCVSGNPPSQYIQINVSAARRSIITGSGLPLPNTLSTQSLVRQN
ncbi:MAG: TadE/TadG family type IV pilus assembly protein [Rhodomicrobium sp.]